MYKRFENPVRNNNNNNECANYSNNSHNWIVKWKLYFHWNKISTWQLTLYKWIVSKHVLEEWKPDEIGVFLKYGICVCSYCLISVYYQDDFDEYICF